MKKPMLFLFLCISLFIVSCENEPKMPSVRISDGRSSFFQWDLNQTLIVNNANNCDKVHFTNSSRGGDRVLVAEIKTDENGIRYVNVPNSLLTVPLDIEVYLYSSGEQCQLTVCKYVFKVIERAKPENYVYTEDEHKDFDQLLSEMENNLTEMEKNLELTKQYRDEAKATDVGTLTDDVNDLKDDLTSVVDEITSYPAKTDVINITSTDFVQGYRHNQSGASIKNDSGYTTTKNVIHFKKGDIFTHPTDQEIAYFFVTTDGAFYETYVSSPYTVPEDVDLYLDCGKSGITPQTTPTVQYTKKTIIEKIVENDESLQAQIDKIKVNFPELEECYKQGDASLKQGYKLSNGVVVSTSATWLCCTENFIECKKGDIFLIINCYDVARYTDSDETSYVSTVAVANLPLYSGNERWNVWVADFDGYVRFTLYWSDPIECAVTKLNLSDYPYTCVCLGDSIFGNNQKPNDLPTYMQKVDGLMTANCGFGGTSAATNFNPIYTPLSFWSIADAISTGDWTTIDVDWNAINNDHVFMANVYILCHLVDWSKVRTLTVAYGTNDWNAGVNIDNTNDPKDVTTYKGALRYGIEKIQSAYPHINIVLLSPLYRYWSNSSDYSTVDDDSDNRINAGRKLTDYVTAMKEVADEYHLPFFDNYNTAGINKITAPAILRDGTHLNYKYGVSMVGKLLGAEVALSNRYIGTEY